VNFEQFFTKLKAAAGALTAKQIVSLAIAFLAVVGLTIGSAYWLNTPTYGVLFSDLDTESANSITSKLKTARIEYVLDDGGRTIRVPLNRVDELRLQYASDGMPGSGHVGFELFDRTSFGTTDFQEHVNYQRALEGELARTISSIGEVAGARVHIAMPKPSLFVGRDQPTKASVVLKLRHNRQLQASTVNAITGLVSAAVESLRPEAVVLMDNFGRPLSTPENKADASEGVPLERQLQVERSLQTRVVDLLEPIVGVGRVRVNVSAKLSADIQEETEEKYDPTSVVRSHSSKRQGTAPLGAAPGGNALAAAGVAGARANLPPNPDDPNANKATAAVAAAAAGTVTGTTLSEDTTNYEVSKTTRHSVRPRGEVTRLSVAVVLDDDRPLPVQAPPPGAPVSAPTPVAAKPRNAADMEKIHGLVAAAVGLDTERGDQLTVENIAFEETPIEEVVTPSTWQKIGPQIFEALRITGIVAIGALALFGVVRPMVKSSFAAPSASKRVGAALAAAQGGQPRTVEDLEAEMDGHLTPQNALSVPALTRRMAALTQKEPENAARLLRTWLTEDK
jgi:flagellar M-ring protein FliF